MYTDPFVSHATASGSTTADLLTSTASAVEDNSEVHISPTENQFTLDMPYLEGFTQPQDRSARSTKGVPPVHFGKVYTHSTIISEVAKPTKYKQTLYVPCYHAV